MRIAFTVTYGPRLGAPFVHPAHEKELGTYQSLLQAQDAAYAEFGTLSWTQVTDTVWTATLSHGNGVEITEVSRSTKAKLTTTPTSVL